MLSDWVYEYLTVGVNFLDFCGRDADTGLKKILHLGEK